MNRIQTAVKNAQCTFIIPESLAKTQDGKNFSAHHPTLVFGDARKGKFLPVAEESFADANQKNGMVVLVEPDFQSAAFGQFAAVYEKLTHTPQLVLVTKSFNRFLLPLSFQLRKIHHVKMRGIDVLTTLIAQQVSQKKKAEAQKKSKEQPKYNAPVATFVGRKEEVTTLVDTLQNGSRAIFVYGPSGIGKHWLLEEAISKLENPLRRVPEITFGLDVGIDTLLSRIAMAAPPKNPLAKALNNRQSRPTPVEMAKLVVEQLCSDALKDTLFVFSGIENLLDSRDQSFYKERSLELILLAILSSELKSRVVFISEQKFQSHGQENLPIFIPLLGIKEEFWQDFFARWHFSDEQNELATKFAHRSKGHPIAMRSLAVSIQKGLDENLLEQSKRGIVESLDDNSAIRKLMRKMYDKSSPELKDIISLMLLFQNPIPLPMLQKCLGINRKQRIALSASGLVEMVHTANPKSYYIHPIIGTLRTKQASFEKMDEIAQFMIEEAKGIRKQKNDALLEMCLVQNANTLLERARKRTWRTAITALDHMISSIRRVTFKIRNYEVGQRILQRALRISPFHPDLLLIEHHILRKKPGEKAPDLAKIHKLAGTPETYHYAATLCIEDNKMDRAIQTLEDACGIFPQNARLRRRLSGLYLRQAQLPKAEAILLEAARIQPLMPDNYSFLGDVYTRQGQDFWDHAEKCFEKAKALGGDTLPLLVRHARLQRLKAITNPEQATEFYQKSADMLSKALGFEPENLSANISMATVLLDQQGDLEAIEKHLKPFLKFRDHAESFIQKARFLSRKGEITAAHASLNKAYKASSNNHYAFYVRGELYFADKDLSKAKEAFVGALDRCPPNAAERSMYEQSIRQMDQLLQTESQLEKEEPTETDLVEGSMGFRRDPGLVVRRKGDEPEQDPS